MGSTYKYRVYGLVVSRGVVLGYIISFVLRPGTPVHKKIVLSNLVADPVETHTDCFELFEFCFTVSEGDDRVINVSVLCMDLLSYPGGGQTNLGVARQGALNTRGSWTNQDIQGSYTKNNPRKESPVQTRYVHYYYST